MARIHPAGRVVIRFSPAHAASPQPGVTHSGHKRCSEALYVNDQKADRKPIRIADQLPTDWARVRATNERIHPDASAPRHRADDANATLTTLPHLA